MGAPADRVSAAPARPVLVYPTIKDPRWFQVAFLFSYVLYALSSPGYNRRPSQYLASLVTCLVLDVVVTYWNKGILIAPLSGLISSMGLLLLCDSPRSWPYAALAVLVIMSKQIIRIDGKHVFNPVNFGVVVGLLFLSGHVTISAGRWGGSLGPMLAIACLGLVVVWRARRADVSLTYVAVFVLGVLVRSWYTGASVATVAAPMTGAAFQLFTFFMISDPMTTPETVRGRVSYAVVLALFDTALRHNQVEFAPFYALFVISGALPLYRWLFPPAVPEQVWRTKTVGVSLRQPTHAPRTGWRAALELATGPLVVLLIFGLGWPVRKAASASSYEEREGVAPDQLQFKFVDASARTGLVFRHQMFVPHRSLRNVAPMVGKFSGASVAVVDFDSDGFQDVYFTNARVGAKNALYRNNHDGTFSEVAAQVGLADVNASAGSLRAMFFDQENDGDQDLFLQTTWCPRFYRNDGKGTFEEDTGSGLDYCNWGYASNVLDYDADGYLDLIVGNFYKPIDLSRPESPSFMPNSLVEATNGGPILVYHNERGRKFARVPDALGIATTGFTHAIGVYDLRGTGRPDVYVASDFNSDTVFYNEGSGRFVRQPRLRKYAGNSMNAEIADVDGDGRPVVLSTQIYAPGHTPGHNDLWKFDPNGTIGDVVREKGLQRCGWAWGAKFVDFDNDSALDLVVTNGFMTLGGPREYWYKQGVMSGASGVLLADATKWPPVGTDSMAGSEADCVYRSEGGVFRRVSPSPIDHARSDGRGVAVLDLMNDGRTTLVVANVDQLSQIYSVEQSTKAHWIGLSLTGTRSNRDAIGTRVTVDLGDKVAIRDVWPTNGYLSQHDRRLLVGIGERDAVRSVRIRWPSGVEQTLDALAIDRYHEITEPR